eukprot:5596913-Pyramimonas_sp.AAC.1
MQRHQPSARWLKRGLARVRVGRQRSGQLIQRSAALLKKNHRSLSHEQGEHVKRGFATTRFATKQASDTPGDYPAIASLLNRGPRRPSSAK